MSKAAPNGYFAEDLIVFGALEKGGRVAQGYVLGALDSRGAANAQLNALQDKVRGVLAALSDGMQAQFQWNCSGDFRAELTAYHRRTARVASPQIRAHRERVLRRQWDRMLRRELRREHLVLFFSTPVADTASHFQTHDRLQAYYAKLLGQLRAQFDELTHTLRAIFGSDVTVTPMDDRAHFVYYTKFLNPSLAERFEADWADQYNPAQTIQENCWHADGVGLPRVGFYFDGRYHAVFTLKRWPSHTYPGIVHRLTSLGFLDYQITVNVAPRPAKHEVETEEKAIERLEGEHRSTGRHSLLVAIEKKKRKVESLSTGFVRPFAVTYIIRVWDETEPGLSAKCAVIKNAVHNLGGAQYYECAIPATAKRLFFASWPGWTGSTYQHRSLYAEDAYLADMLPFSATFVGHLAEAEALFDGSQNNLVGLRTFLGTPPTPQHSLLLGATGAGKSRAMLELLWQTADYYQYTVLIEEGLSYESFTRQMGERPIILHPDGDLTINYFDTDRMPLSQLQLATAVALVARMIGAAPDPEKQQVRQAILARYIEQLYEDAFEEWARRNRERLPAVERLACAAHRWKQEKLGVGATEIDAFADLRDRLAANEEEAHSFLAGLRDEEITAFLKVPATERLVMATAHAFYQPDDYPTHASLVELMQFSRFSEHSKEEIDHLATLLSAWCAHGQYGRLFDGVTNISLTGSIAHFELGYIPEQAAELKTAVGLLIAGFTRQHIISLPQAAWKRIVYEELARFLDVPGGEKIVAESYAQLRKFNCWTASVVQQYSKFKDSRIRPVVIGNSKQFFLMRQFDRNDVNDIAGDIGLPESVCASIQAYPMPEQLPEGKKYASLCFFSPVTDPPLCGTVRNVQPPKVPHDVAQSA